MAVSIGVYTRDDFLWQKIYLALRERAIVARADGLEAANEYDVFLYDEGQTSHPHARRIGTDDEADINLPLAFTALEGIIMDTVASDASAVLRPGTRSVYLRERQIPLTEVEFSLFKVLYDAGGEFVSREALLERVWGGECDGGILNVYVHYLREKLEDGEKIILSSRKSGYKIDARYLGGTTDGKGGGDNA